MNIVQVSLKVAREEHQKIEQLHLNDKRQLQDVVHAKDKQYGEILRNMKLQQSEMAEKMGQSFEERVREIEKRYSDRFLTLRSELQLRYTQTQARRTSQCPIFETIRS